MDTAEYRLVHSVEASVDDTKALKDSFTGADQCHAKDTFKYKDKVCSRPFGSQSFLH
jgi:hypothetical protein